MEPQPAAGNSFIKSEPRIEGSASKNDLSQSGGPPKETNDLNEVSPRATDESTGNPWAETKCTFCEKSGLHLNNSSLLECLHTTCMDCINTRLTPGRKDSISLSCNVCRIKSTSLMENPFLIESALSNTDSNAQASDNSRLANAKCTSCHDNLAATSWCVDCNDFLCDGCVQAHQRLKITEEHTIKPKEEADLENNTHGNLDIKLKTASCSLHPQMPTRTRLQEIDPCEQLEFEELLLQFTNYSISSTVNLSLESQPMKTWNNFNTTQFSEALVSDTNDVFPVEENNGYHICIESSFNRYCDCIKRMISEVLLLLNNIKEIEQNVNADKVEDAQHINRCKYACHSLLLENINPEDASMNKILDATDYAVDHLDEVSLQYLKNIHTRVDPDCKVGVFRTCPVNVDTPFKRLKTTEPTLIIEELKQVIEMMKCVSSVEKEEAILIAMTASVNFNMTHPFLDGNGRCSRVLFTAILKKFEFPFIVIPSDDICTTEYGGSLTIVRRQKDYTPIYRFLVTCIHRSLEMYQRVLQS